ncbi:MAG: hypothetical protein AAGC74_04965 [Verrucomicrobiota bacterium]
MIAPQVAQVFAGGVAVFLGLVVGLLFIWERGDEEVPEKLDELAGEFVRPESADVRYRDFEEYLEMEFGYVNDLASFEERVKLIQQSAFSPIRGQVVTSAFIENGSFEFWHEKIRQGEIAGDDLLKMVAAYLVREDAVKAMDIMLNGPYDFQTFRDLLTFGSAINREAAVVNPDAAFEGFRQKEPNLHRQVGVKWFSDHLARKNPELAAARFDEILGLRDQGRKADEDFTRLLAESWMKTDGEALNDYVRGLPEGEARDLFLSVMEASDETEGE